MIQVGYFKYTKKKYGEGHRIFKMSPLHHHFQKEGYHEAKNSAALLDCKHTLGGCFICNLKKR